MTSSLHIETVNAATKVVQYVRIGRASEDGLDQIALAGNILTAISGFFRAMRGTTPAKVPGILLSCAIKLKPLTQGKTITVPPNWMAIGHDDPAILAHPWAAAARAWADTAKTSFDLPCIKHTPAVAGVSLPTVSQVQLAPNKAHELQRGHPHTFARVVLPKVPQVNSGGKGEMTSAVAGPSRRKEASDDVDIEMSAPETTKVDKGKGRLIEVDPASEQDHVLKKRKIENVSGENSGLKSSMKKKETTSADPDKGSVTPMASHSMPVNVAITNHRVQNDMQMGKLPGRDDGESHRVPNDWHRQPIARCKQPRVQPRWRISMYRLRPLPRHMSTTLAAPAIPSNRPRPSPRRMSTTLAALAIPIQQENRFGPHVM
ncbi:hypothetical protein M405DRAFT_844804 [Rhizopogon salebrosus TDB-379]|nr:hypothetical protein M405DRAFT_844804 [Rhizopogon salebrosus TDB-379]